MYTVCSLSSSGKGVPKMYEPQNVFFKYCIPEPRNGNLVLQSYTQSTELRNKRIQKIQDQNKNFFPAQGEGVFEV